MRHELNIRVLLLSPIVWTLAACGSIVSANGSAASSSVASVKVDMGLMRSILTSPEIARARSAVDAMSLGDYYRALVNKLPEGSLDFGAGPVNIKAELQADEAKVLALAKRYPTLGAFKASFHVALTQAPSLSALEGAFAGSGLALDNQYTPITCQDSTRCTTWVMITGPDGKIIPDNMRNDGSSSGSLTVPKGTSLQQAVDAYTGMVAKALHQTVTSSATFGESDTGVKDFTNYKSCAVVDKKYSQGYGVCSHDDPDNN